MQDGEKYMKAFRILVTVTFIMFSAFGAYSFAASPDAHKESLSEYQRLSQSRADTSEEMKLAVGFPAPPDKDKENSREYKHPYQPRLDASAGIRLALGFPTPPDKDKERARKPQSSKSDYGTFDSDIEHNVSPEDERIRLPDSQRDAGPDRGSRHSD